MRTMVARFPFRKTLKKQVLALNQFRVIGDDTTVRIGDRNVPI